MNVHTLINYRKFKEIREMEIHNPFKLPVSVVGKKRKAFCIGCFRRELMSK